MCCAWLETLSVVAHLDEDLSRLSLDPHEGSGGMGVLEQVGKRFAPDGVQLGFHHLG
jgi:hypothetical protein